MAVKKRSYEEVDDGELNTWKGLMNWTKRKKLVHVHTVYHSSKLVHRRIIPKDTMKKEAIEERNTGRFEVYPYGSASVFLCEEPTTERERGRVRARGPLGHP